MLKWIFEVYGSFSLFGNVKKGSRAVFKCPDAGKIGGFEITFHTDPGPCARGWLLLDDNYFLFDAKLSAILTWGGLPVKSQIPWQKLVSGETAVDILHNDTPVRSVSESKLVSMLSGVEPEMWITDPAVLLAVYSAILESPQLIRKKASEFPCRKRAEKILEDYGANNGFSPVTPHRIDAGAILARMREDWLQELSPAADRLRRELCERGAVSAELPENTESEGCFYYIDTIEAAGTFAIPDKSNVLSSLSIGEKVFFVREPQNPHDANAIRLERDESLRRKLGYVPRLHAEQWAPILDQGFTLCGKICYLNRERGNIGLKVFRKERFPLQGLTSFTFWEGGYFSPETEVRVSMRKKQLLYTYREISMPDAAGGTVEISFSAKDWESFVLPALERCNFLAWDEEYNAPGVCDGTQWRLDLRCGKTKRSIIGSNSFPEEWHCWQEFLAGVLDLRKVRGSGNIRVFSPESRKRRKKQRFAGEILPAELANRKNRAIVTPGK